MFSDMGNTLYFSMSKAGGSAMPWKENDLMSLKKEFIYFATQPGANISQLCRQYSISRKTAYKLIRRYQAQGEEGLCNQSKRPTHMPKKTPLEIVQKILETKQNYPYWGARKIRAVLIRNGMKDIPVASCIHKLFQEHGLLLQPSLSMKKMIRFEHEAPNQLWQMDFKGHFSYAKGRCYPLTILDDHSRYSLALAACKNEQRETVQTHLIQVFRHYGLPERINVDNGNPWGSLFECARYTQLSVWLIKLGVKISYSRPYHPQTNGKEERFHRTLKEELLNHHYFRDLDHIQQIFDQWREIYNLERPHQSLNMAVPADKYHPSYREYSEYIKEYEYADDYLLRKVDARGRIHLEGRSIFVGCPFSKEIIGIRYLPSNELISIYFRHQKIGEISISQIQKGSLVNLYSKRVLST